MVDVVEVDFNNVTREGHIKARIPQAVAVGQQLLVVDVQEREALDGHVLSIAEDGRAIIDVGGGRVPPRPFRPLIYRSQLGSGIEGLLQIHSNVLAASTAAPNSWMHHPVQVDSAPLVPAR